MEAPNLDPAPAPAPDPAPAPKPKPKPKPVHPLLRPPTNEKLVEEEGDKKSFGFLYPTLNDPVFALNIAQRKEFNDTKYEVIIPVSQTQMETEAAKLCGATFELAPHQLFVRNDSVQQSATVPWSRNRQNVFRNQRG